MPPQIRGFGGGPGVGGPFHQSGFPSHGQPQAGPLGANQYLNNNAQLNVFGGANGNVFGGGGLNPPPTTSSAYTDTYGNQSARMGFAHGSGTGVGLQQPQHNQLQQNMFMEHHNMRQQPNKGRIREVWKHNLHEEMAVLRDLVEKYPYIAMVSGDYISILLLALTWTKGYGVPGCSVKTDGKVSWEERLPLPMPAH